MKLASFNEIKMGKKQTVVVSLHLAKQEDIPTTTVPIVATT